MLERDLAGSIVDRETFGFFIAAYTSEIVANPPTTEHQDDQELIALMNRTISKTVGEMTEEDLKEFHERHPFLLSLRDCPWDSIPRDLQELMQLQYEAAKLDNEKKVNVEIDRRRLFFRLRSPMVTSANVDLLSETVAMKGLGLDFTGAISSHSQSMPPYGNWVISKMSTKDLSIGERALKQVQSGDMDALEDLRRSIFSNPIQERYIPATLPQLKRVANFLVLSKANAVLKR